jgi:hypothetical protein
MKTVEAAAHHPVAAISAARGKKTEHHRHRIARPFKASQFLNYARSDDRKTGRSNNG